MTHLPRFRPPLLLAGAVFTTVLVVTAPAVAAGPVLSGPSVIKTSEAATIVGAKFPKNAAVTVFVQRPDGAKAGYGAVTGGDGSLSYRLVAAQPGAHKVVVTDAGGRRLASLTVNFAR